MWSIAAPHLERATDRCKHIEVEDYRILCGDGEAYLWMVWELKTEDVVAVLVTDFIGYPSGWKAARIIACGGENVDEWLGNFFWRIEEWAKDEGCHAVEIVGRKGWGRICPEYDHIESVFSKEL